MIPKLIFCGYLLSSGFLFFFPKFLYKAHTYTFPLFQQALSGKAILNICHRGAPRIAPENTLQSFSVASEAGDMLEMDVCVTKDDVLVVHHDLDLSRTCGVHELVRDVKVEDLPKLQDEIELQFAEEGRKVISKKDHIPTLQEVFEKFPQIPMNIELKTSSQSAIVAFIRLLKQYNRSEITIIGIRKQNHEQLSLLDSKSIRFCSDAQVWRILLAYFTGVLPFLPLSAHALQIPLFTSHFFQWKQREWKNPFKTYFFFAGLRAMNFLMIPMVWHLRKRGVMTFYWVCNSEQQFSRAVQCGAAGIITDEPFLLKAYLASLNGSKI